jgi:hypothetical protein
MAEHTIDPLVEAQKESADLREKNSRLRDLLTDLPYLVDYLITCCQRLKPEDSIDDAANKLHVVQWHKKIKDETTIGLFGQNEEYFVSKSPE